MKDLARLGALLAAVAVLVRNVAVAGAVPASFTAAYIALGVVLLALTAWRDGFATASGIALAGHYVLALRHGDVTADLGVPVVAALILVHMDLLDLAASLPPERAVDRGLLRARLRDALGVFVAGVAASSAALALATFRWPSSTLSRAAGLAGVALVVAIPLGLLRARR